MCGCTTHRLYVDVGGVLFGVRVHVVDTVHILWVCLVEMWGGCHDGQVECVHCV